MTMRIEQAAVVAFLALLCSACGGSDTGHPGEHEQALEADDDALAIEPGSFSAEAAVVGVVVLPDPDDRDADGYAADVDPDDEDSYVTPGAAEPECAAVDLGPAGVDSCLPRIDLDGDGVEVDLDCDDLDTRVRPLAFDVRCDRIDQNCDGHDDCDSDDDGVLDHVDPGPGDERARRPAEEPIDREM